MILLQKFSLLPALGLGWPPAFSAGPKPGLSLAGLGLLLWQSRDPAGAQGCAAAAVTTFSSQMKRKSENGLDGRALSPGKKLCKGSEYSR